MTTLVGVLVSLVPFAILAALIALVEWRDARRRGEILRQIALTDALHARLGALVAPVVRRRGRAWRVTVAVPLERPTVVATVLATVEDVLGRAGYQLVLSRQVPPPARAARPAALRRESLSWT